MAIVGSNLTSGGNTGTFNSQATASVSPATNNLILLSVMSRTNASVQPNAPTASGNGLTWVKVDEVYYDTTSTSRKKLTVLRALGTPTAGAITIDWAGQDQTDTIWSVDQFSGVDTSGTNGSGAVVQFAHNNGSGGGTLTVTLATFGSVNNATFGALTEDATTDGSHPIAGSGFSTLFSTNSLPGGGSPQEFITEWKATNDTSVDASFTADGASVNGGIAIEIKAAAVAASVNPNGMMTANTFFWGS